MCFYTKKKTRREAFVKSRKEDISFFTKLFSSTDVNNYKMQRVSRQKLPFGKSIIKQRASGRNVIPGEYLMFTFMSTKYFLSRYIYDTDRNKKNPLHIWASRTGYVRT